MPWVPDAVLILSFGGPEGPDEVMPFLRNVVQGRRVPPERLDEVASHYLRRGGRSPLGDHCRSLVAAVRRELRDRGRDLPVYWGNRNWHPFLTDTLRQMSTEGVRRATVVATSAYSSYSGCRQYLEDIEKARAAVGPDAPELAKIRPFFDEPGFVEPLADGLVETLDALARSGARAAGEPAPPVLMSAHSIPESMARSCAYERQLAVTAARIASAAGIARDQWRQVYQSRSGPPSEPWLGPDVLDAIRAIPEGRPCVVVVPLGFVFDHMEVVHDLDTEAANVAAERGIRLVRTATPGTDPRFVEMIVDRIDDPLEPGWCTPGCCAPPVPGASGGREATEPLRERPLR